MSFFALLLAIPLTIFVMGGWRRIIPLFFGKRRRALGVRMLALTDEASSLVWFVIRGGGVKISDAMDKRAVAICNFLFSEAPVDLAVEHEAIAWLEANPRFCELVVQSLKVQIMAKECLGEPEDNFSLLFKNPIFLRFATKYPAVPGIHAYESMVRQMVAERKAYVQSAIEVRRQ